MRSSTRFGLLGIGGLALLAAVHQLREMDLPQPPIGSFALGVLPNFAAAIAITFVLLSIWLDQRPDAGAALVRTSFLTCALISGAGLVGWEFFQMSSNRLVFDPADLIATAAGIVICCLMFWAISRSARQDE